MKNCDRKTYRDKLLEVNGDGGGGAGFTKAQIFTINFRIAALKIVSASAAATTTIIIITRWQPEEEKEKKNPRMPTYIYVKWAYSNPYEFPIYFRHFLFFILLHFCCSLNRHFSIPAIESARNIRFSSGSLTCFSIRFVDMPIAIAIANRNNSTVTTRYTKEFK